MRDAKPEIRVSSIKGVLRYWWRACHPRGNKSALFREEGRLFGYATDSDNSAHKSPIALMVRPINVRTSENEPVPNKGFRAKSISPDSTFHLKAVPTFKTKKLTISFEEAVHMVEVALILGGFGQRARRGMGSLQIIERDGKDVPPVWQLKDIQKLLQQAGISSEKKETRLNVHSETYEYPVLQYIRLGDPTRNYRKLLSDIVHKTRQFKRPDVFGTSNPRFASPIWIKVLRNGDLYRPVFSVFESVMKIPSTKGKTRRSKRGRDKPDSKKTYQRDRDEIIAEYIGIFCGGSNR